MTRQPEVLVAGHHHHLAAFDDDMDAVGLLDHVVIRPVLEPEPRAGVGAAAFGHGLGTVGEQGNFEHGGRSCIYTAHPRRRQPSTSFPSHRRTRIFFLGRCPSPPYKRMGLVMKFSPPHAPISEFPFRARRVRAFQTFLLAAAVGFFLSAGRGMAGGPAGPPVYTLADCLALVRKQNPDVLAEAKRVDAARATITTAKGGIYPSLTTTGYYQYREQSLTTQGGAVQNNIRKEDYYGDARVSQNLYSGGAVRNRIAAAKIQTEAENDTYQAQVDTSSLAVRTAFYQTLYNEASIGIRQEAVDLLARATQGPD